MTYEDMCEVFETVRCGKGFNLFTHEHQDETTNETVTIWFEKQRYYAEAQRTEPIPAHRRGTYVTEYGHTVWGETDKRIISAPTLKQLVRKLTEEGEYRL